VARAPEHEEQPDYGQDDEGEDKCDLTLNGEHVEQYVSQSDPLAFCTAPACRRFPQGGL
jgi:hypothetical protein